MKEKDKFPAYNLFFKHLFTRMHNQWRSWSINLRRLGLRQDVIWRGLIAWLIGCVILFSDEISSYDTRLQVRGNQKSSNSIVLVTISQSELYSFTAPTGPLLELVDYSDSAYWNIEIWRQLISQLLAAKPAAIGVTLFIDEVSSPLEKEGIDKIFFDSHITWAALTAQNEKPALPIFSINKRANVGSIEILHDEDGVIRKFAASNSSNTLSHSNALASLAEKVTKKKAPLNKTPFINYRGDSHVFPEYTLTEVLSNKFPLNTFQNKIILIGAEKGNSTQYLTPLGSTSRHVVLAHMVDNLLDNRLIKRVHTFWYILGLLVIMLITLFVMTQYPQTVSFIFLIWIATLWVALSIWVFDILYFWVPITSTLTMIASCYVIFLGYKTNKIERKHFQLQQQQKYLQDLEQLKNNFVSLISHDLKTPIAKIQAILDRLMIREQSEELQSDLKALKQSNEELNRYIQSVLRMLRVESRDFRLHIEVGDINEVIKDALQQLTPLAREKRIQIHLELEPMFSTEFDLTLIREVMVNLIENAIKYTPYDGTVTLRSSESQDKVLIEVTDTGEGIPEDEIPSIWGKFVRGKDQDLKSKGSGLGLYLVKFFIELHGGKIWVHSKIGNGTTMTFDLPVEHQHKERLLI